MDVNVLVGANYCVSCKNACTVTDANGGPLLTLAAGKQDYFKATTPTVVVSDATATVQLSTARADAAFCADAADAAAARAQEAAQVAVQSAQELEELKNIPFSWGQDASISIGFGAKLAPYAITIGANATTGSGFSVVIGANASSSGADSVVIGREAVLNGGQSVVIGYYAHCEYYGNIALGIYSDARSASSIAIGNRATALSDYSIALGRGANVLQGCENSIAIGRNASCNAEGQIMLSSYHRSGASLRLELKAGDATGLDGDMQADNPFVYGAKFIISVKDHLDGRVESCVFDVGKLFKFLQQNGAEIKTEFESVYGYGS